MSKAVRRLFEQFQPENYQLELSIDKDNLRFSGKVVISGQKGGRPSRRITLHQKDLNVTSASVEKLEKTDAKKLNVSRINKHKNYDELRLHTDEIVYPGRYNLLIEFEGNITKHMHGMYPCFFEHEGKKDWLIATQFESHHAREVFPSIDEPEAKATFALTLISPDGETVLSNTPMKSQTKYKGGKQKTIFETTPVMSTYLLAFVIGKMHYEESTTKDGIKMRSYATIAQPKSFLKHANDEAAKILDYFIEYYQTPFPLKKIDQVALPDFESGAMENWGLITYREIALLTDPVNKSISSEKYISEVVAHELSHQWFGNLVTMKWWDDLWLNESFASLMMHIALDALHPDWFQWEEYTASDVIACSSRDIFKDVQPVRVDVNHPDEIMTLFDPAIVYAKGGRLLKMLREYIGDDAFRKGLRDYFAKHAYGNTTSDDLWNALGKTSHKDIKSFMDPWLTQSGMPQVDVTHGATDISLSQKRFIIDIEDKKKVWPVPLLPSEPLDPGILSVSSLQIPRAGKNPVIINKSGSGHMVVKYVDDPSKKYIEKAIVSRTISPESRINILNDYILLARKGEISIIEALKIIEKSAQEPRDAVWQQIGRVIGISAHHVEGDKTYEEKIRQFRREIAGYWHGKLGWDDTASDDPNTKGLRRTALGLTISGEDNSAVNEAKNRYHSVKNIEELPSEQRGLIVGAVVRSGEDITDELINQYKRSLSPDVQSAICAGLASTKSANDGEYIIDKALRENGFVRPQDVYRWYAYLMRNQYTRPAAWDWFTSSWGRLEKMFGDGKSFDHFIAYSAGPINTVQGKEQFENFFKPKMDVVALKRNIKIALSEIDARVAWRNREESKIKAYCQ